MRDSQELVINNEFTCLINYRFSSNQNRYACSIITYFIIHEELMRYFHKFLCYIFPKSTNEFISWRKILPFLFRNTGTFKTNRLHFLKEPTSTPVTVAIVRPYCRTSLVFMRPNGGHLHCLTQSRKLKENGQFELDISMTRAVYVRPKVKGSFPSDLLSATYK